LSSVFLNREYYRNQAGGFDDGSDYSNRHSRNRHHSRTNRALAIILPIVAVLVAAGAIVIVYLYYKKYRNPQNKDEKSTGIIGKNDNYSGKYIRKYRDILSTSHFHLAVPQDESVDKPIVPPRQHQTTTAEA